jgi:signal transduction histidine kinase
MSATDIRDKWLFVAYSEKALASPDNYRDKIKPGGQFAGSKGIGRFACDTLGKKLELYSQVEGGKQVSRLDVDWTQFENDSTEEFQDMRVSLGTSEAFPRVANADPPPGHGTILVIKETRQKWDEGTIRRLRRDLAKLIDPFGTTNDVVVSTWLLDGSENAIEGVDGRVGNNIADLLQDKTSRIAVTIEGGLVSTALFDRGRKIYAVREPSPYEGLEGCKVTGDIYFLNRSAKHTFTSRMGVRPVEFGSVFVFLNGFRISPIGDENDDTLGLARRKQQGQSRYLGTRDLVGRVDVFAPAKMFREVSSRNGGLVEDARSRALYEAIRRHMVFRLERYVVGVNWQDTQDQDRDTAEGLDTDRSRERVLSVVGALARSKDVEVLYYDEELVRVPDDPDHATDAALGAIAAVAESRGDSSLVEQVAEARKNIESLKAARDEAREVAQRAIDERDLADARVDALERQVTFLGSSRDVDVERVQLLLHQATIHVGHVRSALANAAHVAREISSSAASSGQFNDMDDIEDFLAFVRRSAGRLSVAVASAALSGDRLRTVLSFAPNIRVDLETDSISGDLIQFLEEYFEVRLAGVPDMPDATFEGNGVRLVREFSPVDIAVLIDNLWDNARKAKASKIEFIATPNKKGGAFITVIDDGLGIDQRKVDAAKIFERGYTAFQDGTGLGLYSARQIVEGMGGEIELVGDGTRADFQITIPGAEE